MISTMDRQLISEWFAYVRPMYWPVLCLEIVRFWLWAWADAETHGIARQMIIAVNDHGRIRVRFIEDAPAPDWRAQLAACSTAASRLTTLDSFDVIKGAIPDAAFACLLPSRDHNWTFGSNLRAATAKAPPLLDPG